MWLPSNEDKVGNRRGGEKGGGEGEVGADGGTGLGVDMNTNCLYSGEEMLQPCCCNVTWNVVSSASVAGTTGMPAW